MTIKTYFLARFSPIPDLEIAGELVEGFILDSRIVGSTGLTLTIFTSDKSIDYLTEVISASKTHFFLFEITQTEMGMSLPPQVESLMADFVAPNVSKLTLINELIDEKKQQIDKQLTKQQQIEQLETQLKSAVESEDYLRAAELKKRLDELKKDK